MGDILEQLSGWISRASAPSEEFELMRSARDEIETLRARNNVLKQVNETIAAELIEARSRMHFDI